MSAAEGSAARPRLIVGISGASGTIYAVRALEMLRKLNVETHLVMSRSAQVTLAYEMDLKVKDIEAMADVVYRNEDIGAAISSGSFKNLGMLVAPCSIKTLSGIANCFADDLIVRAADVCLKERRKLVLMVRETPLHAGHIELMDRATRSGAVIMPPVPSFYTRPRTIADIVDQTVGRALDQFGIRHRAVQRWTEDPPE